MQKKPSLTKEEDDYEDDFHDDEFEDEEEVEASADKKGPNQPPAPPAKTPEIPAKIMNDNQKQSSGKASTSNDNFKDYGDYDDEDDEEEEKVAPKPKVTFPFQAAAPADPFS